MRAERDRLLEELAESQQKTQTAQSKQEQLDAALLTASTQAETLTAQLEILRTEAGAHGVAGKTR